MTSGSGDSCPEGSAGTQVKGGKVTDEPLSQNDEGEPSTATLRWAYSESLGGEKRPVFAWKIKRTITLH